MTQMSGNPMCKLKILATIFIQLCICLGITGFDFRAQAAPTPAAPTAKKSNASVIHFEVEKFKLANGLTVLFHVDKSAPIVAYYTFFKVGSRNEEPGYTGIAHLFEHMMFKGAKRYDGKTFDRLLGANGAINNAFTTRDVTTYYEILPSSKLELIVDLESDRMANLQITQANLDSEREVVKEERRYRIENQPQGSLFESVFATVFKTYPYRWPVIGWMEDINRISVEKCREFFKTFYAPNNATIVVAGDFNISDAKRMIEKYYGGISAQALPAQKFPEEPVQKTQREARVSKNVQNEHIAISFRAAESGNADIYALEILSEILGGGQFSRLYKKLVYEKQIANAAGADLNGLKGPGVFTIYMSLKPGASHDDALQLTYSILWDARNRLFSDNELQIAKNQVLREHIEVLKTANGKASALGYNEAVFGSYEHLFKDIEKYDAVTLEDLKRVSTKYLNPEQRNLIVLNKFAPTKPPEDTKVNAPPVTSEQKGEKNE